jgi:hypothetical protein
MGFRCIVRSCQLREETGMFPKKTKKPPPLEKEERSLYIARNYIDARLFSL